MAGAPEGNNNASTGRQGRHALDLALKHYPEIPEVIGSVRTLILLWQPVLRKAIDEGDLAALKEINDRLDGRPSQSITNDITIKEKDPEKRKSRIKELLSKTQT